jgi:multidrug resistance efflux pump
MAQRFRARLHAWGPSLLLVLSGAVAAVGMLRAGGTSVDGLVVDGEVSLGAVMPARVAAVHVRPGDEVLAGDVLVRLEGPGGDEVLGAPFDGRVAEVVARAGTAVGPGAAVVRVVPRASLEVVACFDHEAPVPAPGTRVRVRTASGDRAPGVVRTAGAHVQRAGGTCAATLGRAWVRAVHVDLDPPGLLPGSPVTVELGGDGGPSGLAVATVHGP